MSSNFNEYWLKPYILWVKGKRKSCIYDLREKYVKLYHLGSLESNLIEEAVKRKKNNKFTKFLQNLNLFENPQPVQKFSFCSSLKINLFWIELTNSCNFKCIHCYGSFGKMHKGVLLNLKSFEDKVIPFMKRIASDHLKISLIGGEVLLYKDILKTIIDRIVNLKPYKNLHIEIFTNGSLIDDDFIKFSKFLNSKRNLKLSLAISVYSSRKKIHEFITKKDNSFNVLKKNIKSLVKEKIPFRVAFIKTKFSENESTEDIRKALKIPETIRIDIDYVRIVGEAKNYQLTSPYIFSKKEVSLETFKKIKIKSKDIFDRINFHNCWYKKIYISSNLDVYPCVMERRIKYGNLNQNSIENIVNMWLKFACFNKNRILKCNQCEFRYVCFECTPDGKENIHDTPPYCKYEP